MKDKGIIIIRIKGPLKEPQTERFSRYILLCIVAQRLRKKRDYYNIMNADLTLAHKRIKLRAEMRSAPILLNRAAV